MAWKTIDAVGLRPYFDILVSSQDVARHKPEPVDPQDCQVFEDADLGLEAARRAGMIPSDVHPWINGASNEDEMAVNRSVATVKD